MRKLKEIGSTLWLNEFGFYVLDLSVDIRG